MAVADLPEPDSPTSDTVSPLPMEKETDFTASTIRPSERKQTLRSCTSSRRLTGSGSAAAGLGLNWGSTIRRSSGDQRRPARPRR